MTKLSFSYDTASGEYHAELRGYRIRAVLDQHAENPFEIDEGLWPVLVQHPRHGYGYDLSRHGDAGDYPLDEPLRRFTDAQLVHDQHALARIVGCTVPELIEAYGTIEPSKYCRDADELRCCLAQAAADRSESEQFELCRQLYDILDVPALAAETHGYCQGDWARVLVVAPPELQKKFGVETVTSEDLQATIDLYGAWCWGDVYGYIVEQPLFDEDGEVEDWEEVEDGSCWGFYGIDFDKSGLAEAALDAVPKEPVRPSDDLVECA